MNTACVNRVLPALAGFCGKRVFLILYAGAAFLIASQPLHAVIVTIDSFDTVHKTNVTTGLPVYKSAFTFTNAAEALGGERDIFLERTNGTGRVAVDVGLSVVGAFDFASNSGTEGRASLVWDGVDGIAATNYTGLASADLTGGGANNIFKVGTVSDLGASLTLRVYTDAANYSESTALIPADPNFVFAYMWFPFTNFTVLAGSGANFANVGAVSLLVDGTGFPATDVGLSIFIAQQVPEPASAVLWLLGAGGLALGRRRYRS